MFDTKTIEVEANGIRFTAFEMGEGPLALCIHGFPDDARTWRQLAPVLAKAGYRVVAPYTRGYAPTSASPEGVYQSAALGRDIAALLEVLSPAEPAVLIGHDWGAIGSYAAALYAPEKISKMVTMAVPYGPAIQSSFVTNYRQLKRSWYVFFFQTVLAETAVAHDDFQFIRNLWDEWSPTWKYTEADIAPVLATLGRPGVLEAAVNYYRCLFDPTRMDPMLMAEQMVFGLDPVRVPTLYFHGSACGCMGLELTEGMEASFPAGFEMVVVDGAGHFVHRERPEQVSAEILRFLGK